MGVAVGYGAVKVIDAVGRQLVGNVFCGSVFFRQPDRGDFWIGESGIWFFSLMWEHGKHKDPVEFLDDRGLIK